MHEYKTDNTEKAEVAKGISFKEGFLYWLRLGFISFGGPAGQIAMMHKDLVQKRKWISDEHFLQALNFCMLLPGPEAQQLCIYIGWLMHGTKGGIVAGTLFVLPAVFILLFFSWLYTTMGTLPAVVGILYGLKPAVMAIVAEAVIRIAKKSLKNWFFYLIALLSFVGITFLSVPFPVIVFAAAFIGFVVNQFAPSLFGAKQKTIDEAKTLLSTLALQTKKTGLHQTITTALTWLFIWALPAVLVYGIWGDTIFFELAKLFSLAAVVTFGGAYSVLAYVAQEVVQAQGWLQPQQMMDALAFAETTPGPLIMVNQFVGYVAGFQNPPSNLSPSLAGLIAGLLTTWVTFAPSFLMIFLFAPYVEALRKNAMLSTALATVTASVVGVVLNLATLFAKHTIVIETVGIDWVALIAAIFIFWGLQYRHWNMLLVIIGSAVFGYLYKTLF